MTCQGPQLAGGEAKSWSWGAGAPNPLLFAETVLCIGSITRPVVGPRKGPVSGVITKRSVF